MAYLAAPLTNISSTTTFQTCNHTQWGPESIGTIVFGILMFFMALVALGRGQKERSSTNVVCAHAKATSKTRRDNTRTLLDAE